MRKVRLAATQPDLSPPGAHFDCLSPGFSASVDHVIDGHVVPALAITLNLLERCADAGADLAVTCEDITGISGFLTGDRVFFAELAARSEAIAREHLAELAARRQMRIAACFAIRDGNANYNACAFYDTAGRVAGEYRKTHLPPNELWQFTPGDSLDVFDLDIGRVACAICYDMMFPEAIATLSRKGAEIIVHPTGGMGWYDDIGLATLRVRANDSSVFLVTSKNYIYNGAGRSSVIDPRGLVRADAGFDRNAIAVFDADLDDRKTQPDWFWQTRMTNEPDLRKRMSTERRPDLYSSLTEPVQPIAPADEARREQIRSQIRQGLCRW
jgi:predicted amidohydrolase